MIPRGESSLKGSVYRIAPLVLANGPNRRRCGRGRAHTMQLLALLLFLNPFGRAHLTSLELGKQGVEENKNRSLSTEEAITVESSPKNQPTVVGSRFRGMDDLVQ